MSDRFIPSILDRLAYEAPPASDQPRERRHQTLAELLGAVCRDVTALLNTCRFAIVPSEYADPNLPDMGPWLPAYGIPDVAGWSPYDTKGISRAIKRAINDYEPRLSDVRVAFVAARHGQESLHFRIDANLSIEPVSEPVAFSTILRLDTNQYDVQQTDAG